MRRILGCLGYLVVAVIKLPFSIVSFIATNVEVTLSLVLGRLAKFSEFEPLKDGVSNAYMFNADNFYSIGEMYYDEALEL